MKHIKKIKTLGVTTLVVSCLVAGGLFANIALAFTHLTAEMSLTSTGANVTNLQTFLASDPTIYPSGLVTGYYGTLTQQAVTQFQALYGLQQVGNVGPLTLARLNSLIDSGQSITGSSGAGIMTTDTAPSIMNVSVGLSTPQSATFYWSTNEPAQAKIYYSTSPLVVFEAQTDKTAPTVSNGSVVADATFTTTKSLTIPSLASGNTYYYMIESLDGNNNVSVTWPSTFVAP